MICTSLYSRVVVGLDAVGASAQREADQLATQALRLFGLVAAMVSMVAAVVVIVRRRQHLVGLIERQYVVVSVVVSVGAVRRLMLLEILLEIASRFLRKRRNAYADRVQRFGELSRVLGVAFDLCKRQH